MHTICKTLALAAFVAGNVKAAQAMALAPGHGDPGIYHAFTLDVDASHASRGATQTWDGDGWIGADQNRLWLKTEGAMVAGHVDNAELWALYGHQIATYWDGQIGLRHDFKDHAATYGVIGVEGLAPYFIDTAAHLFFRQGAVQARLKLATDWLLTQRLITQPHVEANFSANRQAGTQTGQGLNNIEYGLQTRYEITRRFAPYVDVNVMRYTGETAGMVRAGGGPADELTVRLGLKLKF